MLHERAAELVPRRQGLGQLVHEGGGPQPGRLRVGAPALPVVHPGGGEGGQDVPRPATIVIDRNGVVRWARFADNIQTRPDAREVLRAVRAL